MEVNLQSVFVGLNPEVTGQKQRISFHGRVPCSQKTRFFNHKRDIDHERRNFSVACAASPALEVQGAASKSHFKDFTVSPHPRRDRDIKVRVDASGAMTQAIFDDVFSKLVEAAQPIHGFRRTKGGKTPDIPNDVLLHVLGASKVNRQTIKKIINLIIAEYVEKEGLNVAKDLRVHQSYEELEEMFVPGKEFGFDATIQLQETK